MVAEPRRTRKPPPPFYNRYLLRVLPPGALPGPLPGGLPGASGGGSLRRGPRHRLWPCCGPCRRIGKTSSIRSGF